MAASALGWRTQQHLGDTTLETFLTGSDPRAGSRVGNPGTGEVCVHCDPGIFVPHPHYDSGLKPCQRYGVEEQN